mgnify:FL=1
MTGNIMEFIEGAELYRLERTETFLESPPIKLDQLPQGIVSGSTLIAFPTAGGSPVTRPGVTLAMQFAGRKAKAQVGDAADETAWLKQYLANLEGLGFAVSQGATQRQEFKKKGLFVHEAIIPFLTVALGGAAAGPVIIAALKGLKDLDKDKGWITLFDRESRRVNTREMHFAAVESDAVTTSIRNVVARLDFVSATTNVLFFKLTKAEAAFESETTAMTVDNLHLATIEPKLRQKLEADAADFIDTGVGQ